MTQTPDQPDHVIDEQAAELEKLRGEVERCQTERDDWERKWRYLSDSSTRRARDHETEDTTELRARIGKALRRLDRFPPGDPLLEDLRSDLTGGDPMIEGDDR